MSNPERGAEDVRLRAAVESAPSGLLMVDPDGRIVLVNREVERLFGYPREELLGRQVEMLVPAARRGSHVDFRRAYVTEPSVRAMGAGRDLYGLRKDGSEVPVEIGLTPVATPEGMFVLSSIVDISARKRAEARFRAAVESSPSGMVMVDAEGRILLVNREVERLFGYDREEIMGENIQLLVPERFRGQHPGFLRGFFESPQVRAMGAGRDLFGLRKDGAEVPVEIGLNPIDTEDGVLVLASVVDISERKREDQHRQKLESQLRQAQKMEAVETLAGGIAHDFNNILGAIQGYAEFVQMGVESEEAGDDLRELLRFVGRGKALVERIQRFGRRHESTRVPLSLAGPVEEVTHFLRSSLGPNIEIESRVSPETPRVLGDSSAMHQVLMNLGMNAAQSMATGGRIGFTVEPFYLSDSNARERPELTEGMHVLVSVRDEGEGIDPEVQARVFEPFFTTKQPGKGTGLGLAIVNGIVREHEGVVDIESTPGEGTTVRILIPAATRSETEAEGVVDLPRGSGQKILFVDDEPSLAAVGVRRLERLGYTPVKAVGPGEALAAFRADPEGFAAVISDYLMPSTNGVELAQLILVIRPDVPIILLTGYIDDLPEALIAEVGIHDVLRKPTAIEELAVVLGRTVQRASPSP